MKLGGELFNALFATLVSDTDLLIIDYSKNIRDMYKLKLNDMTIKK